MESTDLIAQVLSDLENYAEANNEGKLLNKAKKAKTIFENERIEKHSQPDKIAKNIDQMRPTRSKER